MPFYISESSVSSPNAVACCVTAAAAVGSRAACNEHHQAFSISEACRQLLNLQDCMQCKCSLYTACLVAPLQRQLHPDAFEVLTLVVDGQVN